MVVSKRVAEAVAGVLSLSPSTPFDLLTETIPWVERYRIHLQAVNQHGVDFSRREWWF